jgi:hypothetical protein
VHNTNFSNAETLIELSREDPRRDSYLEHFVARLGHYLIPYLEII